MVEIDRQKLAFALWVKDNYYYYYYYYYYYEGDIMAQMRVTWQNMINTPNSMYDHFYLVWADRIIEAINYIPPEELPK